MKPETNSTTKLETRTKQPTAAADDNTGYTYYYLLIFRSLVYKAITARRFCHFCSPTLFDLL
jgi:hypothetical protein